MTNRHFTGLAAALAIAMASLAATPAQADHDRDLIIIPSGNGFWVSDGDRRRWVTRKQYRDYLHRHGASRDRFDVSRDRYTAPRDRDTGPAPFLNGRWHRGHDRRWHGGHGQFHGGWDWSR